MSAAVAGTTLGGSYGAFSLSTSTLANGDVVTIFIHGDTPATPGSPFVPAWETRFENASKGDTPPAAPSQVLLYKDDAWRNPYTAQDTGFYLGSNGTCLTSTASGSSPNLIVSGEKTYAFAPGGFSVAVFANPPSGLPDCSGTPASASASAIGVTAGSRIWLMWFGTSGSDKRLALLPFEP